MKCDLSVKGAKGLCRSYSLVLVLLLAAKPALATHPLVTDDAGTQGKGKTQLEFTGEYTYEYDREHHDDDGARTRSVTFPTIPALSYGLTDRTDVVFGSSYRYRWGRADEEIGTSGGVTDTTVDLKHRFFEGNGFGLGIKPGMTIPTGNERKGFGTGRITYHFFFIASKERKPWAFHLNLGYVRNENIVNERKDLWHASVAAVLDLTNRLKVVGDIGLDREPDKSSSAPARFALGGLIYSISEKLDVDIGLRVNAHGGALHGRSREYSIPVGMTLRF